MSKLRVTYRIADNGVIEKKIINLQFSYKFKIFWLEIFVWETIFSIPEENIPPIKTNDELLKIMTDLWLEERKKTLPTRLKNKVINKLDYCD